MSQISAGFNYTSTGANSLVTAGNLNQHVNNAQLVGGSISEQPSNPVLDNADLVLINKGGILYKQTRLEFNDTINSDQINVNDLSAENIEADNLTLTGALISGHHPVLDVKNTNIVASGANPRIYFGYDLYTGAPTAGNSYLYQVNFATKTIDVYNPNPSDISQGCTLNFHGTINILDSLHNTPYTPNVPAQLNIAGNAQVDNDLNVDGGITIGGTPIITAEYKEVYIASAHSFGSGHVEEYEIWQSSTNIGQKQIEVTIPRMLFDRVNGDNDGGMSMKLELIAYKTGDANESVLAYWYNSANGSPWGGGGSFMFPSQSIITPSDIDLTDKKLILRVTGYGVWGGDYLILYAFNSFIKTQTVVKTGIPVSTTFTSRLKLHGTVDMSYGGGMKMYGTRAAGDIIYSLPY